MPIYTVQDSSGRTYTIEGPAGATADQLGQAIRRQGLGDKAAADRERFKAELDPTKDMSGVEKFAAGAGKALTDVGRGAGQMVGLTSRADVEESRRLDKALMGTGAGVAGNVGGNLLALAPVALIPGAGTIVGGTAIGAGMGLAQPSTSTAETLQNVGIGGAAGALVPLAQRAWAIGKAAGQPFTTRGRETIVGRSLRSAAGDDAEAVTNRLRTARELVPGSAPTVGQAADNAGLAALERAAVANNPSVTNAVIERMQAQAMARRALLDDLAGAHGARESAVKARSITAGKLYGEARRRGVDPATLTPEALQNIAQFSQRIPDEVLAHAKKLAKISGEEMTDATSITGLHWVKEGIDDLIGAAQRSGNATLERAYVGLKNDLLDGLDNLSPAYQRARQTFARMSKPINQMDVADAISLASIDPLTGSVRPAAFARSMSDATAQRVLGMPGATLGNTFSPRDLNALTALLTDVKRANFAANAGRGSGSDTVQKLAYTNLLEQGGVPTFIQNLNPLQALGNMAARGGDAIYARQNRELSQKLAEVMLDPVQASRLMAMASPQEQNAIMRMLSRTASGGALAAPSIANAQQ